MFFLPVIVKDLCKDAWVPVEEVLVEYGVIVGEGLGEPGEPCRWDLLQGRLVRLVANPSHVQDDAVLRVHVDQIHPGLTNSATKQGKYL